MKNKLRFIVTLTQTTKQRTKRFHAKAERLVSMVCPNTETTFDPQENKLTVIGIRTSVGLHLAQTAIIALAEGMDLTLVGTDFYLHHIASH
ncbi:MAG TPA: hypothetical protein DEF00_04775 [Candidatus Taylorbacteria bacterium]|nr:MAG: hypothetical protein UY03_C0007G0058 [Parcubacteria group bacterium GW2011_GWA2_47_64]KKU95463.1 MAG: hypothetical protein UY29_C0026G0008 [Parcubacteria group bacterium GW2011_GWC2_48_17]HBV01663.1 hypothetical protein [Candidatus Taylorbacteria bacterium]